MSTYTTLSDSYRWPDKNIQKSELIPCLGTNYIAFSNAIRLDVQAFFELEKQKTHTGTPSLEDYIKAAKSKT